MNAGIGGITSALKVKAQTPAVVQRFFTSTQTCRGCHSLHRIQRKERTYRCERCGLLIDRDLNAARNMEKEGLMILKKELPTERLTRREITPADASAPTPLLVKYLNNIPRVRASAVVETGSSAVVAWANKPSSSAVGSSRMHSDLSQARFDTTHLKDPNLARRVSIFIF